VKVTLYTGGFSLALIFYAIKLSLRRTLTGNYFFLSGPFIC